MRFNKFDKRDPRRKVIRRESKIAEAKTKYIRMGYDKETAHAKAINEIIYSL
jgi:hypothetical protein